MTKRLLTALACAALATCAPIAEGPPSGPNPVLSSVEERSIEELQRAMTAGETSSEAITYAYLARIDAIDRHGPQLNSVLAVNPAALDDARALDAERRGGHVRGPLHGVPILIKDNIEALGPLPTTAGSLALKDNVTNRDAPLVARLRDAGAVILGKTNLSEWANIRSDSSTSGWSAMGGVVHNPHALDRNACGSSSGSGAATAASLAAGAIGTETDGSITCPASINGIVGLKPTVGLVSRTHVVPISASQDTAGPMTRTVRDAAILLTALAGTDPADPATAAADAHRADYAARLSADGLKGVRIGVMRDRVGSTPAVTAAFDAALAILKTQGAVLVEIANTRGEPFGDDETIVLRTELKAGLAAYLATTPPQVTVRSLADVIAFDDAHAAEEMPYFGQDTFLKAQARGSLGDKEYLTARARSKRLAGAEGIDRLLAAYKVSMLVAPTTGPAWLTDLVNGDSYNGPSASQMPAVAGYPHLTVPMGEAFGLPFGISFIGPAWSEAALLSAGYAYEQAANARLVPRYLPTADVGDRAEPPR